MRCNDRLELYGFEKFGTAGRAAEWSSNLTRCVDDLNCALQAIIDSLPTIDQDRYSAWLSKNSITEQECDTIRSRLSACSQVPSLSILLASAGGVEYLRATLRSLEQQIHQGFEVVIACVSDELAEHRALAAEFPNFPVSTVEWSKDIYDIVSLENAALDFASGDYVGFLAPGDRLAPEATAELALALVRHPQTIAIYTDEDWIDATGRRSKPRFKTAWDPDAQLGFDLFGRFSPVRLQLLRDIGGLDSRFGLAAHYDLHCRVADKAGPLGILHLPSILRHAARQQEADPTLADAYAMHARKVAKEAAWRLEGIQADIFPAPLAPWHNRVRWNDPDPLPMVSILMPTRDRADLLAVAARGILDRTDYPNIELLILDNDSVESRTFSLFEDLSKDLRVRVIHCPGPFNYSKINNRGAKAARGDILVLLNNDVDIIEPNWLREMVCLAVRSETACVGAKLLYEDGRIQHAGVSMAPHTGCAHVGRLNQTEYAGDCGSLAITTAHSAVTAACLAIRRCVFDEVGGLDETHLHVGYNDVDLCLRTADHGYRSVVTPFAVLYHLESVSRGPNDDPVKRAREKSEQGRLTARYREVFLDDPYQNPNLHLAWEGSARLVHSRRCREWEAANRT